MRQLEAPDLHLLQAAQGWMGLGSLADALTELRDISPENQRHPAVLELRWIIHIQQENWEAALAAASELLTEAPDSANSWLHHAYALRRAKAGGLAKARAALEPALEKFPKEPVISYNLSCYACQMQDLEVARQWFHRALKVGKKKEIKTMALADPDLEPLWEEIRQL
ncbi:MAG: tetratricopeptide repeat protein [Verrucomicrobiota bacterium]